MQWGRRLTESRAAVDPESTDLYGKPQLLLAKPTCRKTKPLLTLDDKLDHLPGRKRREIAYVVQVIFQMFEEAQKGKLSDKARAGRILKLVLYGSHARGNWVEDRGTGYMSDYDLLAVVNYDAFAEEENDVWMDIDDRLIRDELVTKRLKAPVSIIAHSLADVNDRLACGLPFFIDIIRDGITLYEAPGHPLGAPGPLTPEAAREQAQKYFDKWFSSANSFLASSAFFMERGSDNEAAFVLHQATERLYHCVLLVLTLYSPKLHNIRKLRDMAEGSEPRLIEAWPRNTKFSRRCYELLRRAYVEARYSPHYEISSDELKWLVGRVEVLAGLIKLVCEERLAPA